MHFPKCRCVSCERNGVILKIWVHSLPEHRPAKPKTSSACDVTVGDFCSGTPGRPTKPPVGKHENWFETSRNKAKQTRCGSTRNSRLVRSHSDSQRAGKGWQDHGRALAAVIKVSFNHVKINERLWGTTNRWLERKTPVPSAGCQVKMRLEQLCISLLFVSHCKPIAIYNSLYCFFLIILLLLFVVSSQQISIFEGNFIK